VLKTLLQKSTIYNPWSLSSLPSLASTHWSCSPLWVSESISAAVVGKIIDPVEMPPGVFVDVPSRTRGGRWEIPYLRWN
jgi:hypothetical protein